MQYYLHCKSSLDAAPNSTQKSYTQHIFFFTYSQFVLLIHSYSIHRAICRPLDLSVMTDEAPGRDSTIEGGGADYRNQSAVIGHLNAGHLIE